MKLLQLTGIFCLALPVLAQPRSPEVFGQIGYGNVAGDDGSLGNGAVYGGAATLPFRPHWALDIEVLHTRSAYHGGGGNTFGQSRTIVSPAVLYRRGSERAYWFAGGGAGYGACNNYSQMPGSASFSRAENAFVASGRTGVVARITGRLLVRFDVHVNARYVLPDFGATVGIGYRF